MKLGNSKGNNTGKKYFLRADIGNEEPTAENVDKAMLFNEWFADSCQSLINFLIGQNTYDEDTFNNTFLRISEKILYTGADLKDYKAYFHRSYYTNFIQTRMAESRYTSMPQYDTYEAHHSNPYERERMQLQLELDVFDYVYKKYELKEFELFKMYVNLKPAINYQTLAALTHIKAHSIQRIISTILTDVRSNKKLAGRYREVK